ncbi:MAG: tRNA pseudouridine(55) synthase TruB [Candidatus Latescibacteria bacterium]|nr:tRNA pseudouridine(55) synthase TruB [Candidatus Latescibacterota bacterium]
MKIRGVLPLNKPIHLSSYDCIRKLKPIFPNTKLGHAGTLDPIAQGLLLILFNEATKIGQYLSDKDKEYVAKIRLGIVTDTDDITGQIIDDKPFDTVTQIQVEQLLKSFIGEINQLPPKFSALKQKGQRSYVLARKGIDFSVSSRKIIIKEIELLSFNLPIIEIRTMVSKGTYIRALARDIGEKLGCGATLEGLNRTQIGRFRVENAVDLEDVRPERISENIYPINEAIAEIPAIVVNNADMQKLLQGQPLSRIEDCKLKIENCIIRVVDNENRVLVIAKYKDNKIYPERLIYADI